MSKRILIGADADVLLIGGGDSDALLYGAELAQTVVDPGMTIDWWEPASARYQEPSTVDWREPAA